MNKENFEKAMGEIDDSFIEETVNFRPAAKKRSFRAFASKNYGWMIAACFCVCVLGVYAFFGGDYYRNDAAEEKTTGDSYRREGDVSYYGNESVIEQDFISYGTSKGVDPAREENEMDTAGDTADRTDKIIYRADLNGETKDYEAITAELEKLLDKHGAYIETQNTNEYGEGYKYIYIGIRVPAKEFKTLCDEIEELCHITSSSINADNVSERYHDAEGRLKSAQAKLDRLNELMEKAETMEDIITLEEAINQAQWDVDYYTQALKGYDSQIEYASINLEIREVYELTEEPAPQSFGEKLGDAFSGGIKAIGSFFGGFVIWLAYAWFWIIAAAVIIVAVVYKVKHRKKKE